MGRGVARNPVYFTSVEAPVSLSEAERMESDGADSAQEQPFLTTSDAGELFLAPVLRSPTPRVVGCVRLSGHLCVRFGQTADLLGGWLPGSLPNPGAPTFAPLGVPSSLLSGSPSLLSLLLTALVTNRRRPHSSLRGVSVAF